MQYGWFSNLENWTQKRSDHFSEKKHKQLENWWIPTDDGEFVCIMEKFGKLWVSVESFVSEACMKKISQLLTDSFSSASRYFEQAFEKEAQFNLGAFV